MIGRLLLWLSGTRCGYCHERLTTPGCTPVGLANLGTGSRPTVHTVYAGTTADAR